ncbi:hypothetical protein BX600DRAFT_555235 [Xylariales sp. PMI_506]|nr:hypothetical protein BX600DRAFT_555235 [Xylariales sp. PMI_506]
MAAAAQLLSVEVLGDQPYTPEYAIASALNVSSQPENISAAYDRLVSRNESLGCLDPISSGFLDYSRGVQNNSRVYTFIDGLTVTMSNDITLPKRLRELAYDDANIEDYQQWCASQGSAMNPIMGIKTVFDKQRAQFMRPVPWRALQERLASIQDSEIRQIVADGQCDWDEVVQARDAVLDKIEEGRNIYGKRGSDSFIRRLAREGANFGETLESLLDMIPDDHGLRCLRAGLVTVLKLIRQRAENRTKLFEAFEGIPSLFAKAQQAWKNARGEKDIQLKVQELYEALLEEIPRLIDLLLHRHRESLPLRLLKYVPEQESNDIDASHQRILGASKSLDSCIETATQRAVSATYLTTSENLRETKAVRETIHTANFRLSHIADQAVGLGTQLSSVKESLEQNTVELQAVKQTLLDKQRAHFNSIPPQIIEIIQTNVYYAVLEADYTRGSVEYASSSPLRIQPSQPSMQQVFEALEIDVPFLVPSEDMERVTAQGKTMEMEALGRGRWLMTEHRFRAWLISQQSDYLLVDGHCGAAMRHGRTSPLSVFSACLAGVLAPTSVSLHFFCGQHFSDTDPLAGPRAIVRSLIVQVLQYPSLPEMRVDFIDKEFYEELREHDLAALCDLFQLLIRKLESGTLVLCIIDNICEYESSHGSWNESLHYAIRRLVAVSEDENLAATFKLMITCKNRSTSIFQQYSEDKHVALRAGNIHTRPTKFAAFASDIDQVLGSSRGGNRNQESEAVEQEMERRPTPTAAAGY